MPIERLHWRVLSVQRRVLHGADRGKITIVTKQHNLNGAINDSREIQLGTIGSVLQWTPLSRFSLTIAAPAAATAEEEEEKEGAVPATRRKKQGRSIREATLKNTFPDSEFEMVIVWDVDPSSASLHSRLVLGRCLEPDGSRRILGLLELEPPWDAKKKEVLREGHIAPRVVEWVMLAMLDNSKVFYTTAGADL